MYRENRQFYFQPKETKPDRPMSPFELANRSFTRLGPWEISTVNAERVLSQDIQRQATELIRKWVDVFPKEPTWIQQNYGIPSLLVRIDGVDTGGKLGVYEVEERPAGIGHTVLINSSFSARLAEIKETWPNFDVVISPLRDRADDEQWNNVVDLASARGLSYVRAEPEEMEFQVLQESSVSTIVTEGDKSYGVPLGLWEFIDDPAKLPQRKSFVLKPLQSSKGRNMAFYDVKKRPSPGNSKMKNVIKVLEEQIQQKGGMFIQELIPPMDSEIQTHPLMIYRFFFGYNFASAEWVSMGGTWFARNNLKIHGASDSLSGPLVIK